jgi:hypothetical protein
MFKVELELAVNVEVEGDCWLIRARLIFTVKYDRSGV